MEALEAKKSGNQSKFGFLSRIYHDAGRALILDEDVYKPYVEPNEHYARKGFGILFWLALPAGIAIMLGLIFDWLTLPRADLVQQTLFNLINGSALFQSLATQYSSLGNLFPIIYNLVWLFIRVSGGYPFPAGVALAPFSFVIGNLFNLWLFAFLLMFTARHLGGKVPANSIYPALALAFAPQLLNILNFIPGLTVPSSLISIWMGMTVYQVIRTLYGFSPTRSLWTLILSIILEYTLLVVAIILGVVIGVAYSLAVM
jgi:hypothetical protein